MPLPRLTTSDEFYMLVGRCITAWAQVEEQLFTICLKSLKTSKTRTAIVYYRTPTLDARLTLTHELVGTILPKRQRKSGGHDHPKVKEWDELRKQVIALLETRRRIAHQPVADRALLGQLGGLPIGQSWIEIYTSADEKRRRKDKALAPLQRADLNRHYENVLKIAHDLERFASGLLKRVR